MGQQARQAAAGQGRDRGGEAPKQSDGVVCWSQLHPDAGTPQGREVIECEGRWLLAGMEACLFLFPFTQTSNQSLQEGSWQGLGKGNSDMPPGENESSS